MIDDGVVERYLDRIGAGRPGGHNAADLRRLHVAHLFAVPFENLSIHLGERVALDDASLVAKIVDKRRGGFCYELNGAFAALLWALGFEVTLLAARAYEGELVGPPFDHLVLRVDLEEPWLVDVGFGDHSLYPLRLDDGGDQTNPAGTFTIAPALEGDLEVSRHGRPQYRIEMRARNLEDFEPMCWWHATSPASHFTRSLTCSLPTAGGRITLSDRRLIITTAGRRSEELLASETDVLAAYRDHFGIVLDRAPHLAAAASL